jgi:hypothetical protein
MYFGLASCDHDYGTVDKQHWYGGTCFNLVNLGGKVQSVCMVLPDGLPEIFLLEDDHYLGNRIEHEFYRPTRAKINASDTLEVLG